VERKITIEELEAMLNSDEELDIEVQPDGSIVAVPKGLANNATPRVLTLKQALGDKY
jgi:hypothetical protein